MSHESQQVSIYLEWAQQAYPENSHINQAISWFKILEGQIEGKEQQRRRDLFEKVALRLLPNCDIPFNHKDIMQKARGFTAKLINEADDFAKGQL